MLDLLYIAVLSEPAKMEIPVPKAEDFVGWVEATTFLQHRKWKNIWVWPLGIPSTINAMVKNPNIEKECSLGEVQVIGRRFRLKVEEKSEISLQSLYYWNERLSIRQENLKTTCYSEGVVRARGIFFQGGWLDQMSPLGDGSDKVF